MKVAADDHGPVSPWYSERAIQVYLLVGVSGAVTAHVALLRRPESAAMVPVSSMMRNRYCTGALEYVIPPPVTTSVGVRLEVVTLLTGDCATGALALSDVPPGPPAVSFRLVDGVDGASGVAVFDVHASDSAMSGAATATPRVFRFMP